MHTLEISERLLAMFSTLLLSDKSNILCRNVLKGRTVTGEAAQWLRTLDALAQDPGAVSSECAHCG